MNENPPADMTSDRRILIVLKHWGSVAEEKVHIS